MPKISAKLLVTLISITLLQSGCAISRIVDIFEDLSAYETYDIASYMMSDDEDCGGEAYENDTCAEAINPFPDKFILALTEATQNMEDGYYTPHDGSVFRISNDDEELLYEVEILRNMNDNSDYGFSIVQGGYTCTSIIRDSNPARDDSLDEGEYITTNCVNDSDSKVSCHLCYNLFEKLNFRSLVD